MLVGSAISGV
jgi:hypothetical protein